MVAVSADCGGGAAVGRSQEVAADIARDPQFADVFDSPEAQALLEELTTPPSRYRECFARLQGARATVTMMADDADVSIAARRLETASFGMLVGGENPADTMGEDLDAYETALTDFEAAARADARERVSLVPVSLAPLVIGLGVALLGSLAMFAILQRPARQQAVAVGKPRGEPSSTAE